MSERQENHSTKETQNNTAKNHTLRDQEQNNQKELLSDFSMTQPKVIRPRALKTEELARAEARAILRSRANMTPYNPSPSNSAVVGISSSIAGAKEGENNSGTDHNNIHIENEGSASPLSLRPIPLSHRDHCTSSNPDDIIDSFLTLGENDDDIAQTNVQALPFQQFLKPAHTINHNIDRGTLLQFHTSSSVATSMPGTSPPPPILIDSTTLPSNDDHNSTEDDSILSDEDKSYFSEKYNSGTSTSAATSHSALTSVTPIHSNSSSIPPPTTNIMLPPSSSSSSHTVTEANIGITSNSTTLTNNITRAQRNRDMFHRFVSSSTSHSLSVSSTDGDYDDDDDDIESEEEDSDAKESSHTVTFDEKEIYITSAPTVLNDPDTEYFNNSNTIDQEITRNDKRKVHIDQNLFQITENGLPVLGTDSHHVTTKSRRFQHAWNYISSSSFSDCSPNASYLGTSLDSNKSMLDLEYEREQFIMNQANLPQRQLNYPVSTTSNSGNAAPVTANDKNHHFLDDQDIFDSVLFSYNHDRNSSLQSHANSTVSMEYSEDEDDENGSIYQDSSYTSTPAEHFARNKIIHHIRGEFVPSEYKCSPSLHVDKKRWLMSFYISALNFLSGWSCYSIAPIVTVMSKDYPNLYPSGLIPAFLISQSCGTILQPIMLSKFGLRGTVLLGSGLLWFGSFIRTVQDGYIDFSSIFRMYLGFCIIGISKPMYHCSAPFVSTIWFPSSEQTKVTSLMMASSQLGIYFAFILSFVIMDVKQVTDENKVDITQYFDRLEFLTFVTCVGVGMQFDEDPIRASGGAEPSDSDKRQTSFQGTENNIFRNDSTDDTDGEIGEDLAHKSPKIGHKREMKRAITPSGKSVGPPSLYAGRAILMSNSEGTTSPKDDELTPIWNMTSTQYGTTIPIGDDASTFYQYTQQNETRIVDAEPISTYEASNLGFSQIQIRRDQIFVSTVACFSQPGFIYSLVTFVLAEIVITTLTTYMDFLIQFAIQNKTQLQQGVNILNYFDNSVIPAENSRSLTAIIGGTFAGLIMISSFIATRYTEQISYFSTILGLLVLSAFALAECGISLDIQVGWDVRWSLLLVAILMGPLRSISTELGVADASPLSKTTVLIIQELFASGFCALSIPFFQAFRNVRVTLTDGGHQKQNHEIDISSSDDTTYQYTFSFYFLISLHICAALFFATYSGKIALFDDGSASTIEKSDDAMTDNESKDNEPSLSPSLMHRNARNGKYNHHHHSPN